MENPKYPKEWLNLRLEFTEEYLLNKKRIKQMRKFKETGLREKEFVENKLNAGKDLENKLIIVRHDNPLKYTSILKNPNGKVTDYGDTIKKYYPYKICCKCSQCILM